MRQGHTVRRRGNAVVEFAVASTFLLPVLIGVWQFGYTFYLYNALESAVRNGARYASLAAYDGGSQAGAGFKARVKNMVVYGDPNPTGSPAPVVAGLLTANVQVVETFNGIAPAKITVGISGFAVRTFFQTYNLTGKPKCSFDYMGRFTVP